MGFELFVRGRRLTGAALSDLVEKAENPKKMAALLINRIEDAILAAGRDKRRAESHRDTLVEQKSSFEDKRIDWLGKAEFVLSKKRSDLARDSVLESEKLADLILDKNKQILEEKQRIKDIDREIKSLEEKLIDARRRHADIVKAEADKVSTDLKNTGFVKNSGSATRSSAIEELDKQIDFHLARSGPETQSAEIAATEHEIDEMQMDQRVEEKLAELSKKSVESKRRQKSSAKK